MDRALKLILPLLCLLVFISADYPSQALRSSGYDIADIYEKVELRSGAKALDAYGNLSDAKAVFVPTKLDPGKYEVELNKIGSNFYQIYGTSYCIETKHCYEYAMREDAILNITSNYGYTRGEVIFLD
ncbi:MAG: hypothetical protein IJY36_07380 [Coprobacter sp.]|nr:hypothetical protein [Coprobacter sp.]